MDDKQGNYYVVRTDEVTPAAMRPFDQIKDKVAAAWKADVQAQKAKDEANKIADALRAGKPASSFAGQEGVTVSQSQPVSLLGQPDPTLPAIDLPDIIKLKKGEAAVFPLKDKQLVVRLAKLTDAMPDEAAKSRVISDLKQRLPTEHAEEYLKYLNTLFPVTVHQDAIDQVAQRGS